MLKLPTPERGKPWTLRTVRRAPKRGGEELWGYCDAVKREIVVWKSVQEHGVAREVLLHELLHRLMWFLEEEAVEYLAEELDFALDVAEAAGILEL